MELGTDTVAKVVARIKSKALEDKSAIVDEVTIVKEYKLFEDFFSVKILSSGIIMMVSMLSW